MCVCVGELTDSTVVCQGVESFRECLKHKSVLRLKFYQDPFQEHWPPRVSVSSSPKNKVYAKINQSRSVSKFSTTSNVPCPAPRCLISPVHTWDSHFVHMQSLNTCNHHVTSLLSACHLIFFHQSHPLSTPHHSCPSLSRSVPCWVTPSGGSQSSALTACPGSDTNVLYLSRLHFPWDETGLQFLWDRERGIKVHMNVISPLILFSVCYYQLSWIPSLK